ncbi:hypothetical protein O6H91_03G051500 [Diphasiastrum complanatum]|uniref:Uncharacterized protein n=1 Tax=Diphasiastrum complanatum TaxID=34168 RepID=A0ACC2E651_DIPCM|nr:hypothetical protein O6H91_03G051500 [Diphasiastrum complanatum]
MAQRVSACELCSASMEGKAVCGRCSFANRFGRYSSTNLVAGRTRTYPGMAKASFGESAQVGQKKYSLEEAFQLILKSSECCIKVYQSSEAAVPVAAVEENISSWFERIFTNSSSNDGEENVAKTKVYFQVVSREEYNNISESKMDNSVATFPLSSGGKIQYQSEDKLHKDFVHFLSRIVTKQTARGLIVAQAKEKVEASTILEDAQGAADKIDTTVLVIVTPRPIRNKATQNYNAKDVSDCCKTSSTNRTTPTVGSTDGHCFGAQIQAQAHLNGKHVLSENSSEGKKDPAAISVHYEHFSSSRKKEHKTEYSDVPQLARRRQAMKPSQPTISAAADLFRSS